MLISRIAVADSQASSSAASALGATIGDRKGSLNHLWHNLQQDIAETFREEAFVRSIDCQVLDVSETDWIPTSIVIRDDGNAEFHHKPSDSPFAIIKLPQSSVIGHLGKFLVQISGNTQTFLLNLQQRTFGASCATLLAWSRMRPAGLSQKMWCPPPEQLEEPENDLLRCEVKAHFTVYNPQYMHWSSFLARLKRNGEIQLSNSQSQTIYSLQMRNVLGSRVKLIDPSVVDSKMVILLFPDMGGPESVYLKFNDIDDFEDWTAALKALSLQPVAAPLSHDPINSVRWQRSITVTIESCRRSDSTDDNNSSKSTSKSSVSSTTSSTSSPQLSDTYIDICMSRWVFGRTCLNSETRSARWNQTFSIPGPETTPYGVVSPNQLEFKLKHRKSTSASGTDQDFTMGSHVLHQITKDSTYRWYDLKPSNLSLYASATLHETPILDQSYYSKLYNWMSDLTLCSTNRLVSAMPSSLPKLFPIFNEIYRAQGRHIEWILSLASEEIKTIDVNTDTVFREASLFTRSMEYLLQQQGDETLQKTVGRFVRKLVAGTDDSLELDPARNHNLEEVNTNAIAMGHFLNYLWSLIRSEGVPPACRPIFYHMKMELKKLDLPEEQLSIVMHRAISSLLFLRYYVPALLNPTLYNLTNKTILPVHRRTLVLVSKILQTFANRVKFGSKEMWLVPMNKFIEEHDSSLAEWYGEICAGNDNPILSIRKVDENEAGGVPASERPPKELPMDTFMGQQLTSPNLIDEWAAYSRLANLIADEELGPSEEKAAKDFVVGEFLSVSKSIVKKQESIISSLGEADKFEESVKAPSPNLYLNKETLLFGTEESQLEPEVSKIKRSPSLADGISRLGRLPRANSPTESVDDGRQNQKPPSSVRKLTQMLRISKPAPSSSGR